MSAIQSGRGAALALARIHNGEDFLIHTICASVTKVAESLRPNLAVRRGAAGYIDQVPDEKSIPQLLSFFHLPVAARRPERLC